MGVQYAKTFQKPTNFSGSNHVAKHCDADEIIGVHNMKAALHQ
jgi:hypothetical protein